MYFNKNLLIFIVFFAIFVIIGCSKEESINSNFAEEKQGNNETLESNAKLDVEKLHDVSKLIAEMSDNKKALMEIEKYCRFSLDVGYDEEVKFSDLLKPGESKLINDEKAEIYFDDHFYKLLNKKSNDYNYDVTRFVLDNDITIYWPYSECFDKLSNPVVTFNPMEEVKENIGYKKVISKDGGVKYEEVVVDDDYAYKNPVLIVGPSERYIMPGPPGGGGGGTGSGGGSGAPSEWYHKIQIGHAKCTKQYDFLWNGGSEFKFVAVKADDIGNETVVPNFDDIETVTLSRYAIRKENWVTKYQNFIPDWKENEVSRLFAIFEEDGGGELTITGYVKINIPEVGTVGVEAEKKYPSRDPMLSKHTWERDAWYRNNRIDQGHGYKEGWPIRHSAAIYWTYVEVEY